MDSTATYDRDVLEKKLHDPTTPPIYLPIQFLKDITCSFSREQELGRGGYGVVYKGVLRSGKIIAVKKIFDIHLVEDDNFQREASYLMGIKHKNIVQLVGYCAESRWELTGLPSGMQFVEVPTRLLCFEYMCNESLDKYVSDESSGLDWCKRFEIIKGICSGLHFLHEKHIVHLDLKPGNILMDASMIPKVADFGLSRLLGAEKSRTMINGNPGGSLGYMAPEYSFQGIVSRKADIFSFGVIIIQIITGGRRYPLFRTAPHLQNFDSPESIEIYIENVLGRWRNIFHKEPKYTSPEIYTQQVKECITMALNCVEHDPSRRPNAWEIFQMLSAVENTKCHEEYIIDSVDYQAQASLEKDDENVYSDDESAEVVISSHLLRDKQASRPTSLQDHGRDTDDEDFPDRDSDVEALASNLSQAFRYGIYSNDDIDEDCASSPLKQNQATPVHMGEISEEELSQYDGSDPNKPLLIAIKGLIYDVTPSRMFYGPGGPYALFSGKDASRALAKMSFEPEDLTGDISGLNAFEMDALQDWEYKFMSKYVKVGTVKKTVPVEDGKRASAVRPSHGHA